MGREQISIKENPRKNYKATERLILDYRVRQLPMKELLCGNQSADISLINRREKNSLSIYLSEYG